MLRNWNLSRFLAVHVPLFPHPQTYPHSFCPLRYLYLMQLHIFPHFLRCLLWLLSCYVAQKLLAQLFQLQLQLVVGVWRPSLAEKGLMSVLNFVAVMFRFILTNILFVQANKMENALKKNYEFRTQGNSFLESFLSDSHPVRYWIHRLFHFVVVENSFHFY